MSESDSVGRDSVPENSSHGKSQTVSSPEIHALDDLTIARIAAGEVIERPASVVKELLENSLDAGAQRVDIEIQEGGRRLIQVSDDGHGIRPDQIELAIQKHATSKITRSEDLASIESLGFRGEALASIASVSHMTLRSRALGEDLGVRLRVDNGKVLDLKQRASPVGTTVKVENLFNAVPARMNFLKRAATEAGHIHDLVARYALAHPGCRISLRSGNRRVLRSSGSGDVLDALAAVFGSDIASELLPFEYRRAPDIVLPELSGPGAASPEDGAGDEATASAAHKSGSEVGEIIVRGYASPPHLHRSNRKHMTLIVGGRWVQSRSLIFAISQAYHGLIPKGRFPLVLAQIELPADAVDVNVHPAKTEVRFRQERVVFASLQRAIRAAILGQSPIAPASERAFEPSRGKRPSYGSVRDSGDRQWASRSSSDASSDAYATGSGRLERSSAWGSSSQEEQSSISESSGSFDTRLQESGGRVLSEEAQQASLLPHQGSLPILRPIGQLAKTFILAEGPDGLYMVDQHAAHERIMYEAFMLRDAPVTSQALLAPETVALPARQVAIVEDQVEEFRQLGLDIEPFGHDSVIVRSLPEAMADSADIAGTMRSIMDALEVGDNAIEEAFEAKLTRAVCKRASIKAGQALEMPQIQALLRDLEACDVPRTCPHGRPTLVLIERRRIELEFGRS